MSYRSWSSEGCNSNITNDHVICSCDHLTSFAVLLQYTDYKTDPKLPEGQALTLIGQIGCAISVTALLVTFSIFLYLE